MSAEEQTEILAAYIQARFPGEITEGGVGEVAVRILEKYVPDDPQSQMTTVPDEDIIAEIRMPDSMGRPCMTFILLKWGDVRCWSEFGDVVSVEPLQLEAVATALETLYVLCPLPLEEEPHER